MVAYRDRLEMVRNLLEVAHNNDSEPAERNYMSKTRLGFTASLTHTQTTAYLDELLNCGLIVETVTDFKPHCYYQITERGRRCLAILGELDDELKPELEILIQE